ncbi:Cyclin-dependent kinase-like 3 [Merluccius polli]|uniref:Cyclin-dependent kinase-like 3 n=1 Tax=Merluccius polli TaxID=89951 RepID=A0AA47N7X4_MERPO|nr:Cyclin-dependent kinase-like 3 [Merluccius polli]
MVSPSPEFSRATSDVLVRLHHDNLVKIVSHFKEDGRLYCVFELMDRSVWNDVKQQPQGLESDLLRKYVFQMLRGMEYLHSVNVLHRDIKPQNLLVSCSGVVKVADLGLGLLLKKRQKISDYGPQWFLSAEALTADGFYTTSHDVWAIGRTILCMARLLTFSGGDSRFDHIHWIASNVGPLTVTQEEAFIRKYPYNMPPRKPWLHPPSLEWKYKLRDPLLAQLVEACLNMNPKHRATCSELLCHEFFTCDSFHQRFPLQLAVMVQADQQGVPLIQLPDGTQGSLDPDTAGPHKASSSPEIYPSIPPEAVCIPPEAVCIPPEAVCIPPEAVSITPD